MNAKAITSGVRAKRSSPSLPVQPRPRHRFAAELVAFWVSSIAAVLLIIVAASSAYSLPTTSRQSSLAAVATWVEATGKLTVIRGPVAKTLGLGKIDVRVRERGFRVNGDPLTHVCSTIDAPGSGDVVLLALLQERTGDAFVWRATRQGELISSATFASGIANKVDNQVAATAFVAQKDYFTRKMRLETFRTHPAPETTPQVQRPSDSNDQERTVHPLRKPAFSSELMVLLSSPWAIPAVAIVLVMAGAHRPAGRR